MDNQKKINPYPSNGSNGLFGHDSHWGYQTQPQRECVYPHMQLLYMLDNHIFQKSVIKKNTNPYPGYKAQNSIQNQSNNEVVSFNPNTSFVSPENQRSLGKFDLNSGGFNNQRELRGIIKDEKYIPSRDSNITMFSYGRF
jgi:hypothetical protein